MQISFQNDSEALKLLNLVSVHPLGAEFQPYIRFLPQQGMYVDMTESVGDKWLILLSEVFHSFLLEEKMLPVIEQIIISKFFYREREEIEAITEIASSIIEGERARCQGMLFSTEKKLIEEGLQSILAGKVSFSFDSFTTFRLKSFQHTLEKYVVKAIDEYKLEQDYQNFIATLRDCLHGQESKLPKLHLVNRDGFQFYDQEFSKLDRPKINSMIDRRLLAKSSLFLDTVILAPLLSIAPENLYIYTDDKEEGLIQTMARIFEERATVLPLSAFSKAFE
ncbi:sporulation protein YtxC [Peribacillus butanolivorans]|uniref:Sporulation protein YtxC n=1 Tax=Peribacillus butanolivorans TaxID=421767 RepID=A0AAX0RSF6_9BACI|nr:MULTISPECIES: sporulation protein YtxC [Peribacillus]MBK5462366.1 putative sporulation protein YtxC [Peribacillus sp. TH27]MBK5484297.1 putative sporulation protein YtxC [Peribacillus sp. TH16]MBK5500516.1 putative sporulation protein YtxC [Peribacillus sp. TH14]AXN37831.1 putative sporulation protein YtxC [Peribacillus butanolivorans]MBK5442895.1 putative sporulation protein YtxC [Peribacillus sp. TH24]